MFTTIAKTFRRVYANRPPAGRRHIRRPQAARAASANCRRGMVLVWTVLIMLVVIALIGLTIDVSFGMLAGQQLQNAADAASLAGVQRVREYPSQVRYAAITTALANYAAAASVQLAGNEANAPDGDIVIGRYNRTTGTFTATLTSPNAVKVVARRTEGATGGPLGLLFGPLFGVNTINVERAAIAMVGGGTGAGILVLNEEDDSAFRLSGTVELNVYDSSNPDGDGVIQVNSASEDSLKTDGNPTLIASEINVFAEEATDPPEFDGEVNTSMPRVDDPLAGLAPPSDWGTLQYGASSITGGTHNLQPGHYPDGIKMTGGTVNLAPGVYVVDGLGLEVNGGDLYGDGVMFYIVGSGHVKLTGNGVIEITPEPIDEGGPYGGIVIWQSADNPTPAAADITGTDQFGGIDGTLYFPTAHVDVTGTSDSFGIRQLICYTLRVTGNGTVTINYDGRFPAPGTNVFLVE